ncbi:hypothetical protein KM759_gp064 [Lymphocystis disease virus 4]|uniref:Uncharacterized protein n=1 Tax=Lymphocystis disease virus 4 TaxID=2704413 RepID=A0A6B9XL80_9VIRU|nr:hypothetical protein KM759_gp064 [Lymphocystis disease virus 4]QHR78464.1 hypothetical protein [Lymphocystis disease virus 4]
MLFYVSQFRTESTDQFVVRRSKKSVFKSTDLETELASLISYWWGYVPLSVVFTTLKQDIYPIGSIVLTGSLLYDGIVSVCVKMTDYLVHIEIYNRYGTPALKSYFNQHYIISYPSISSLIKSLVNHIPQGKLIEKPFVLLHPRSAYAYPNFLISSLDSYVEKLGNLWWGVKSLNEVEEELILRETKTAIVFTPEVVEALLAVAIKIENDEVFFYFIEVRSDRYVCSTAECFWSVNSPELTVNNVLKKENAILTATSTHVEPLYVNHKLTAFVETTMSYYKGIIEGDSSQKNEEDLIVLNNLSKNEATIVYHNASSRFNYLATLFVENYKYEICYSRTGYMIYNDQKGYSKIDSMKELLKDYIPSKKNPSSLKNVCLDKLNEKTFSLQILKCMGF